MRIVFPLFKISTDSVSMERASDQLIFNRAQAHSTSRKIYLQSDISSCLELLGVCNIVICVVVYVLSLVQEVIQVLGLDSSKTSQVILDGEYSVAIGHYLRQCGWGGPSFDNYSVIHSMFAVVALHFYHSPGIFRVLP